MTTNSPVLAKELSRYGLKLEGRIDGGNYGNVYGVKELNADNWSRPQYALKLSEPTPAGLERLQEKGLSPSDVINKEFLPPGYEFMIPRVPINLGGVEGILMPYYKTFAHEVFGRRWQDTALRHFHSTKSSSEVFHFLADLISGVNEYYQKRQKAHGDIKFENIAFDDELQRYRLGDLGSSYYAHRAVPGKPGSRIGDPAIRAPELFTQDPNAHPTRESDSWSIGALGFAAFTGEELWQPYVNYRQPIKEFSAELEHFLALPIAQRELKNRLKLVPKCARETLDSMLAFDPKERKVADAAMAQRVRKLERRYNPNTNLVDIALTYGKVLAGAVVGAAVFSVAAPWAYEVLRFEPAGDVVTIVKSDTAIINDGIREQIHYETTTIPARELRGQSVSADSLVRDDALATTIGGNDPTYRTLWHSFRRASSIFAYAVSSPIVSAQANGKTGYDINAAFARRLKIALDNQRQRSKVIEVEDVLVDMFLGEQRLLAAKEHGKDYFTYSQAEFVPDKPIVPEDTRKIIAYTVATLNQEFAARNPKLAPRMLRLH